MKSKILQLTRNSSHLTLLVLLTTFFTLTFSVALQKVSQAAFARPPEVGYFTGRTHNAANGAGVGLLTAWGGMQANNVDEFVAYMRGHLNASETQRRHSAAFIILTMMGYPPGSYGSDPTGGGNAVFPAWEARVRKYAAKGLVDWNIGLPYSSNTKYAKDLSDVVWYGDTDAQPSITFWNTNRSVPLYQIKRSCGNPVGNMSGLPDIPDDPISGNARLRIRTNGLPIGTPAPFTVTVHSVGGCGTSFTVVNVTDCSSGAGNGIGWHDHGGGARGGTVVRAPASVTAGGVTYTFSNWSGDNWSDGGVHCSGLTSRDRCVNLAPAGSGTSTGEIIANFAKAVSFSCGTPAAFPTPVEIGQPFTLRVPISTTGGTASSYNYTATLTTLGPPTNPGTVGGSHTATGSLSADSSSFADFPNLTLSAPGNYKGSVSISFAGGGSAGPCVFNTVSPGGPCATASCPSGVTKPYFQARAGDVAVGISSCTNGAWPVGGGLLKGWNNGAGASNLGAGTDLAAFALSTITQFASAQSSSPPKGLSFSSSGTYGGNFGAGITCPNDYFSKRTGGSLPSNDVQDNNNAYNVGGPLTLGGGSVTGGHRTVIFVNGNVRITSNITASSGGTLSLLSSFYLVANGNIYIDPGVSQLDGVYIAQGGNIYTCANGFGPPSLGDLNGSCKNTVLTVNGAFIARAIKLYRSFGTMSSTGPAERFNYTPATWLAAPCAISGGCGPGGSTDLGSYEAITSLPPVL